MSLFFFKKLNVFLKSTQLSSLVLSFPFILHFKFTGFQFPSKIPIHLYLFMLKNKYFTFLIQVKHLEFKLELVYDLLSIVKTQLQVLQLLRLKL